MRTIVCTTGISVAQGVGPYASEKGPDDYRQRIVKRLDSLRRELPDHDFLKRASAEINSLFRLNASSHDHIYLLHSETPDGQTCAEEVRKVLEAQFGSKVTLVKIDSLQVHDAARFRRQGIHNLFRELNRIRTQAPDDPEHSLILNATGGFKSTVPYITLYGLFHHLDVFYIFEQSDALIRLPAAPIHFDYDRLVKAADALAKLSREEIMSKEAFFQSIPDLPYDERDIFEMLLDEEDGCIIPSALGMLLLETIQRETARVYLSPSARRCYEESQGKTRESFDLMLTRVADPLWRKAKEHRFYTTDLLVCKPGKIPQRMAYVIKGNDVYVCELFATHKEYEKKLEGRKKSDYNLSEFTPWVAPTKQEQPISEDDLIQKWEAETEAIKNEKEELYQAWQRSDEELQAVRQQNADLQNALHQAKESEARLAAQVQHLESENAQLKNDLQRARRPWWRRWFG